MVLCKRTARNSIAAHNLWWFPFFYDSLHFWRVYVVQIYSNPKRWILT